MKVYTLFQVCIAALVVCCGCQHSGSGIVGRVKGVEGLSEQHLIANMGEPLRQHKFIASASAGKFYTGLERIAVRLREEDVLVQELTWGQVDYLITAWLYETNGTWIALDTLKYEKGVRF